MRGADREKEEESAQSPQKSYGESQTAWWWCRLKNMLEGFDPSTIEDQGLRAIVVGLMNLVEKQQVIIAEQSAEIQRLRDEISRLKGEQGKPKIRANIKGQDLSSEKQRRESKPHQKNSKQAQVKIDREELVKVDRQQLPSDAAFKGYQDVVVQDITFRTENILFRHPRSTIPPARSRRTWQPCQQAIMGNLGRVYGPGCWRCITKGG
jgi:hypothetical protein